MPKLFEVLLQKFFTRDGNMRTSALDNTFFLNQIFPIRLGHEPNVLRHLRTVGINSVEILLNLAMPSPEIKVVNDADELSRVAAEEFKHAAQAAIEAKGRFTVALAGGSTPKGLYSQLAKSKDLPWDKIYFFFGDERHVPPDHLESNYRMVNEALFSRASVPPDHIFRMPTENADAEAVAQQYERTLQQFFQLKPGNFPIFDLVLLGLGPDGHTASLFPGTTALRENSRLVVANWVPKFNAYRLTFTVPVLNQAKQVMFLVSGKEKRNAAESVLASDSPPEQFPAKLIRPRNGKVLWLVDRAALPPALEQRAKLA
jgi:6-phosphogluconolactonase